MLDLSDHGAAELLGDQLRASEAMVISIVIISFDFVIDRRSPALLADHGSVDGCGSTGLQKRNDAVSRGNLATILGVSGAVLVGAGATLYYFGRRASAPRGETRISARFVFDAAPGALVTGIAGGF